MSTSSESLSPSTIAPIEAEPAPSPEESADSDRAGGAASERRRLEAELAAIERKREELARALVVNAHPELADPIRLLTGRLYAVARVEERMREPLTKSETRKVESLGKKREQLVAKRAELDARRVELETEIGTVDHELALLGEERTRGFERERVEALEQLVVCLAQHGAVFDAAGVDPVRLVEGLEARMPEVRASAEQLAARATA